MFLKIIYFIEEKMKIINSNFKKGEVKIQVQNLDDLWYLSTIIDTNDIIKGKTQRKIKVGQKQQAAKKTIFLKIQVEKVEFSKHTSILRASGKIIAAPEEIPLGTSHTFNLEPNTIISIEKQNWLNFQKDKLKEASTSKPLHIMIVVLDREEAFFAIMRKYSYELLSNIQGEVYKKRTQSAPKSNFYSLLAKQLKEYDTRYKLNHIVIASPAFWKEELIDLVPDLKKKIIPATCSSASLNGINEVLKRPEVKQALKEERVSSEIVAVEKLLEEISKQSLAAYGLKEVTEASDAGAIENLLITDSLIQKSRQENKYQKIESIMKNVDANKGKITIISSEHDGGKKLDGLGGIGAILRYRLNY
tara:strand:- start:2252 stop:3334 length:1083 start_codon:yes stop_codon:yes gene_type:complete